MEIRCGDLLIRATEEQVAFEVTNPTSNVAIMRRGVVPEIIKFLNSYLDSQKDRRVGFRLDLSTVQKNYFDQFHVTVEFDGRQIEVRPIDLSLSGIRVECGQFIGEQGAQVGIKITFNELTIVMPSIVVRQSNSDNQAAFHFIDVIKDGILDPPTELKAVFTKLEALWLSDSLNLEWHDSVLKESHRSK